MKSATDSSQALGAQQARCDRRILWNRRVSIGIVALVFAMILFIIVHNKGITNLRLVLVMGLLVSVGLLFLLENNDRLVQTQEELRLLNEGLLTEKNNAERALNYTMEVYDALNLFSLSNPERVVAELARMVSRAVAKDGCALFKLSSLGEVTAYAYEGMNEREEAEIAQFVIRQIEEGDKPVSELMVLDRSMHVHWILDTQKQRTAVLIMKNGEMEPEGELETAGKRFYLHLIEVILQQLDAQEMVEGYIVGEEQNRIASEIHDTVIQKLFYTCCNLADLKVGLDNLSREELIARIEDLIKTEESTMKTLREAIYGIRWDQDEISLENKIGAYIEEVQRARDVDIGYCFDPDLTILGASRKQALYRIVCEAINNAVRYSKADIMHVSLVMEDGFVVATIQDNGIGFDKNAIPKDSQGIKNMYIIAGVLKGTLQITTKEGKGTQIMCRLPV